MKKIYLLAFTSLFTVAVNAQTTLKIKNLMKKGKNSTERNDGPNSVSQVASTIVSNTQYVAGTTMDMVFTLTMTNTDGEYGDYLGITFPAGITPTGNANTSNPFPNTEDNGGGLEPLNPVAGQLISWGTDNDDTYGGIWTSTGIQFTVNCVVAPATTGSLTATYDLKGDKYASTVGGVDGDQLGATFIIYPAGATLVDIKTDFIQTLSLTALNVCNFGMDTLVAQIKNLGTTTESNISVVYSVNGVAHPATVVAGPLAPGDSTYAFWLPAYDFSASNVYDLKAWTAVASDIDLSNDTAALSFSNSVVTALTSMTYSNPIESTYDYGSLNRAFVSGDGYLFGPSQVTFLSGAQALFYTVPSAATAGAHEAMVILPCMDVVNGETYRISFYKRINGSAATANGQSGVFTGLLNDATAMTTVLKAYSAITPYATWIKDSADFVAAATETRYFALGGTGSVVAGSNQINVRYDDINIAKVSGTSGVKSNNVNNAFIYPNPTNGILNIVTSASTASIEIYNTMGQNVMSKTLTNGANTIDMGNLSNGVYNVRVMENNTITNGKVIKTN